MSSVEDKKKVSNYIASQERWGDELKALRKILNQTDLEETVKWGGPAYTLDGKILIGIAGFKNNFTIWFHQGVFLKDKQKKLVNAQDGKTKAMRQWRFSDKKDIDGKLITEYLAETIANHKAGKQVKPERKIGVNIPPELTAAMTKNKKLKAQFAALTPGKQREYAEHIASAKQEKTRLSRLEKAIPLIIAGAGLNDKYKNC